MPRPAWFGLPPFLGQERSPGEHSQVQGLVIAGGGAKASFQIGALRYLYEHEHIAPTVITATSAGSILGALLAQFEDPAEQEAALRRIEDLWLSMQTDADMFTERAWFTRLLAHQDLLASLREMEERRAGRDTRVTMRLRGRRGDVADAADEGRGAGEGPLAGLTPQERTLALAMSEEPGEPVEFNANLVYQLLSELPRIGRIGSDLTAAVRGLESNRSLYRPGPLLERLLSRDFFRSELVASSGVTFRCAIVGLGSGELRYMREDGKIVDRDDHPLDGPGFDVTMGTLASCSVPGIFRPVEMNGEWYVDGGVRENVPVEAAVKNLGVTQPFVIVSSPPGASPSPRTGEGNILSILFRVESIRADESERDEVAYARAAGATVIEPEILIHDAMTIDPGLLSINRDYGWIRAAEATREASCQAQAAHREIIRTRLRAWRLEKAALAHDEHVLDTEPGSVLALPGDLAETKKALRAMIERADRSFLPDGGEGWWNRFEGHPRTGDAHV
ncbi:Patatin-like phospholipase (PNPLA) domain profile [Propionibacterium ruminifibrarum]|uniref:Patatin-like phospholipase (PNPLA) domain profile n=1 Tax=Propionibacterium ruminifibrarum TaxID=1962131 RepID=A0A375I463_9ACTN|nr:patatin-like phospholipase family protein [Propionibacterium ruminifibrarum]SPF68838.1 Patatin-like phospholipase (PNPLA) domain profile [Propionibacterium ruminifibrarum]